MLKKNWMLLVIGLIAILLVSGCQPATVDEEPAAANNAETEAEEPSEVVEAKDYIIPEYYRWPADEEVTMVDTSEFKTEPPYTIGFSNCSTSNAWASLFMETAKWEAAKYPEIENLLVTDANDDPSKQLSDAEDLLAQNIDILIVRPCTADAAVPAMERAVEMGIPVLISNRGTSFTDYVSQQATSMYDIGRNQGEWLAEALGGEGNVVSLEGTSGSAPAQQRYEGAMEMLSQYPGIEVATRVQVDWSQERAKSTMENLLQTGEVDGVLAQSGTIALGSVEAIEEAGLDPCSIPVTGDDYNGYVTWIANHECNMVTTHPTWCGGASIVAALMVLNGQEVPEFWNMPTEAVDASEIDSIAQLDKPDGWYPNILPADWEMGQ
jgi:ribose transport system substrate-binding protein